MFVCAGNGEEFDFAESIGVGLIQSAINLTKLCVNQKPEFLCFVGSAGSYDFSLPLLEICVSEEAVQIEKSSIEGQSYTPISLREKSLDVSCETIEKIKSLQLREAIVNSSNYITTDSNVAKLFKERGILLENMEFYSVLSVANAFGIPAVGIFCVSNYCCPQAHEEFVSHYQKIKTVISSLFWKLAK